jgi:Transcriptional regulator, AbiEi antitoxin, Type IV TA system
MNACWGGEVAAPKLTGHLKPQVKTLYRWMTMLPPPKAVVGSALSGALS